MPTTVWVHILKRHLLRSSNSALSKLYPVLQWKVSGSSDNKAGHLGVTKPKSPLSLAGNFLLCVSMSGWRSEQKSHLGLKTQKKAHSCSQKPKLRLSKAEEHECICRVHNKWAKMPPQVCPSLKTQDIIHLERIRRCHF